MAVVLVIAAIMLMACGTQQQCWSWCVIAATVMALSADADAIESTALGGQWQEPDPRVGVDVFWWVGGHGVWNGGDGDGC